MFSFGKKQCEMLALQINKFEINTEDEKKIIAKIFNNAIETLSEEDQKLPQVK